MNRKLIRGAAALALALLMLGAAAGCAKNTKELDIDAFCGEVLETVPYDDQLVRLSENAVGDFYAIPFDGLEEYAVYVSGSMATSNELAVMRLSSDKAVEAAREVVAQRLSDQLSNYENYVPGETFRLEQSVTVVEGNYLLFSVSNDNETVKKMFSERLK